MNRFETTNTREQLDFKITCESISSVISALNNGHTIQFVVSDRRIIIGQRGRFHNGIEMDHGIMDDEVLARGSVFIEKNSGVLNYLFRDQTIDTLRVKTMVSDFLIAKGLNARKLVA